MQMYLRIVTSSDSPSGASAPDGQKRAQTLRRLGALHMRPGGGGAGASADAWAQAATLGSVDVNAWLEAALGESKMAAQTIKVLHLS